MGTEPVSGRLPPPPSTPQREPADHSRAHHDQTARLGNGLDLVGDDLVAGGIGMDVARGDVGLRQLETQERGVGVNVFVAEGFRFARDQGVEGPDGRVGELADRAGWVGVE